MPPELDTAATCKAAFFRVSSALEQLEGEEAVRKHTLFTTRCGHLVEAVGGSVHRSTPAPKDVTKIVVHQDYEPLQRYVVLVCRSEKAALMAYTDLKVLQEWEEVKDVASVDPQATGTPQLILTKGNGRSMVVSNAKLMSYTRSDVQQEVRDGEEEEEEEEDAGGKKDAVQALMHRFKGGLKHADQLRNERKTKENFITQELGALQSWLKGQADSRQESLVAAVAIGEVQGSAPKPTLGPLKVLRVFHNVMHDKWVIMINVQNEAQRLLVSELELLLCCEDEPLQHTSQVLKSVKHSSPRQPGEDRVTIDHLHPLLLRPRKRATVVGVCNIPSFKSGPSVSCSGLLSYTVRPHMPGSSQTVSNVDSTQAQTYQVPIPPVTLEAHELYQHVSSWEHCASAKTMGVSFSTVALVAASVRSHVSLRSLLSPINGFLAKVSQHHQLIKVPGVSDLYVLHPRESHPLQHSAFILYPVDAHTLSLDLLAKNEKQTMVLAHSLLAALPKDTSLSFLPSPHSETPDTQPHTLQHMLLAKIKETSTLIVDGLEAQLTNKASKIQRKEGWRGTEDSAARYSREREEMLARKGDIVFKGEEYRAWRKGLQSAMLEVDGLYLKYLKVNCG